MIKLRKYEPNPIFNSQILNRTNNIFELVTVDPVTERIDVQNEDLLLHDDGSEPEKSLRLKGKPKKTLRSGNPFGRIRKYLIY